MGCECDTQGGGLRSGRVPEPLLPSSDSLLVPWLRIRRATLLIPVYVFMVRSGRKIPFLLY